MKKHGLVIINGIIHLRPKLEEEFKVITLGGITPGMYSISNHGRIKNNSTNEFLRSARHKKGYLQVGLALEKRNDKGKKHVLLKVHRLVLITFSPIKHPERYDVNHINTIRDDNFLFNLEWVSSSKNSLHAFDCGYRYRGTKNSTAKINDQIAKAIWDMWCDGKRGKVIIETLNLYQYSKDPIGIIRSIYSGAVWNHITRLPINHKRRSYKRVS